MTKGRNQHVSGWAMKPERGQRASSIHGRPRGFPQPAFGAKKCRPDWDITTPELKAAWQQGRKELFYPYGKTYAQTIGEQD
jgi:hypothetical protein